MTQEQFNELLRSQQGELNAVLMYQRLAKVVKTDKEREAFLQLAREEGRHANVFHVYTKQALKPKKTMAFIMLTPAVKVFTHEELQTIAGIVMRYDGYVITDQKIQK